MDNLKGQKVLNTQMSENNHYDFIVGHNTQLLKANCLLCNEDMMVSLTDNHIQVCERCKQAWSKMRDIIENSPKYATGVHINHVGRETIAKTPNYTEEIMSIERSNEPIGTKLKKYLELYAQMHEEEDKN